MKRLLVFFVVLMLTTSASAQPDNYINDVGALVEEVSLLNLLRGLYLNEDQAKKIAALALEAESIRESAKQEVASLSVLPHLTQLRDDLFTALAEDPPAVRARVVELDNRAHQITGQALDKISQLEEQVRLVLTHGQQKIFWDFVPCIVPELDLENPVRTGQAEASSRLMPALKLIRATSEDMWKKHGQDYLDHILKVIEQDVGKMTEDTREDLRRRLVKHAWKIRKMKEADFMIHRNSLAEDLLLINREHTRRSGYRLTGKIARFLLSPTAVKILPRWVETHFSKDSGDSSSESQSETAEPSVTPAGAQPAVQKLDQSVVPAGAAGGADADKLFWSQLVPKSLARLSETPYYDRIYHAFGKPYSLSFFDEENRYVDYYSLIEEAGVILQGERPRYYSLTPGEP